jgi:hypothetical protein
VPFGARTDLSCNRHLNNLFRLDYLRQPISVINFQRLLFGMYPTLS